MKTAQLLHGLLIDPYQRKVHKVVVANDISAWHKLLDCDCLDVAHVGNHLGLPADLWVDDEGLLYNPVPPTFRWINYPNPLAGYGLLLSSDQAGESTSTNWNQAAVEYHVQFEGGWESRIKPEDVFDQLSRIYPDEWGTYGLGKGTNR